MFLCNIKLNGKRLVKFLFIAMLICILVIFSIGIYNVFFKKAESQVADENVIKLEDTINTDEVFEITPNNYTDILQTVTDNLDNYIGCKIHFTGYVYRLIDFDENEFVLARDMLINKNTSQTLVVGFLCTYDNAKDFEDDTWVDITGTIVKGDYYGDIAEVEISSMTKCEEPIDNLVLPPSETYIPTSSML